MRYLRLCVLLPVVCIACAAPDATPVPETRTVNPIIEQAIETRVLETEGAGVPDIRDLPNAPPALPSAAAIAEARESVLGMARALVQEVRAERAAADNLQLSEEADRLREAVARDRSAAAREGSLASQFPGPR